VENESLNQQLTGSAAQFAQSGLRARADDPQIFLLHIATALEQLLKAMLASLHPSLIASPNHFDSLLHLSGHPQHAKQDSSRLRTITMSEALTRAGQVLPAIANLQPDLKLLAETRNGIVHVGRFSSDDEIGVLSPFLKACEHLVEATPGIDRKHLWGDYLDLVDRHLQESAAVAELNALEAITLAKQAFEQRFLGMDAKTKAAVIAGIVATYEPEKYEQSLEDCPACGQPALISGAYETEWQPDFEVGDEGEVWSPGAALVVTFHPGYLECRVCGLELDGDDQLVAAEIEESWQIEDVDPRDFVDDNDPW
jgi:hypothetical protein